MLKYVNGDVLGQSTGLLVHGCNATTSPAGGIAGVIFDRWPNAEKVHHELVNVYRPSNAILLLGEVSMVLAATNLLILNAITQMKPGAGSLSYEAVRRSLIRVGKIAKMYNDSQGTSLPIIMPKIGAGIAGGDWKIIEFIINETLTKDHEVIVYVL